MKSKVTSIYPGKCKVLLLPQTDAEQEISDADTLQAYYQAAIHANLGPKALLMSIDEMEPGYEVTANYKMQGGSLGNR